jgi:endonuclease G
MPRLTFFLLFCLLAVSPSVGAAPTGCPAHFADGAAPEIVNTAMRPRTKELCFTGFAVMHSSITLTPLWSAEHLTKARIDSAGQLPRVNSFHAESKLRPSERATLADYKASGWDRGHMSPNGDMPNKKAQRESFSLANIIPQAPRVNQNLWEGVESAVRVSVRRGAGLYVITGPIFEGNSLEQLNGRVLVPTFVYKAIYDPENGTAGAYVASNAKESGTMVYETVTIDEIEKRIGIVLFPLMPDHIKKTSMTLPRPIPHGRR